MTSEIKYIKVAFGLGADKEFTYLCPPGLVGKAVPGQRVVAKLGVRERHGFIIGDACEPIGFQAKEIMDIPDDEPLVPGSLLALARWVASYYKAPLGQALSMALPPGLEEGRPARPRVGIREARQGLAPERPGLNPEQADAVERIKTAVLAGKFEPFLLHGVTGSGKTEVYLRAIEALEGTGRGAVVLVPEISLTPQAVRRFSERFGESVAVLHSGLTDAQRRQQWRRIRQGEASVAVGARSAVFAPFKELGAVIVDEEHDGSYKQEDGVRYNARDVAVMRAKMSGCPVVLGSATPSAESYCNALKKKYALLKLSSRATGTPLPSVKLIDMKDHPVSRQLSPPLMEAARRVLDEGRQALFFINRRGFADFLVCRDCGWVPKCPSCSVSLTYHRKESKLACHWCASELPPPEVCPKCGGAKIKYVGGGTERLERELKELFSGVSLTRIDRDTARGRDVYSDLLAEVETGRSRIMLGTQMVAKGHDIAGIGLVGVAMADYGLNLPDFRAAERTFQTVTQAAGRCGRGDVPGEVCVQTYQPENPCLVHAAIHDYEGFYSDEIKSRRELGFPPFSRLAVLIIKGIKREKAESGAEAVSGVFRGLASKNGVTMFGPAPAPLKRIRARYRYFILLKSASSAALHRVLDEGLKSLGGSPPSGCRLDVDVDPQSLI